MIPLIWLVAGVVLVAAEALSGAFVLLMLGVAALAAGGASALGVPVGGDVAVFAVASAALVLLARPALTRRLAVPDPVNTGTQALLGARAEVLETVHGDGAGGATGTVRLNGSVWSARALHEDAVLTSGTRVVVVSIRGATAVVISSS